MPHPKPSNQDNNPDSHAKTSQLYPANAARLASIGWDGLAMLALSMVWIGLTFGVSFIWAWIRVISVGKHAGTQAPIESPLVVLGVCLAGKAVPNGNYSYRLQRAIDLQPRPVLILGGFTHADSPCSEAAAGRDWLIAQGVNEALIFTEDKSTNTLENLYGVQKFVTDHGFDVPCLISNRFHLARCSLMAQGLGIEHHLCAAEASFEWSLKNIATVMLEAFFINAYWVGRWVSKIFKHKGILGRISSRCQNDND